MDKDKIAICKIISDMLDNPDESGIYPTSTCYTRLEEYIAGVRAEANQWRHANADDPKLIYPEHKVNHPRRGINMIRLCELYSRNQYINVQKHPVLPLLIWNYNQKCLYESAWDEYTRVARGLITDLDGNIIARPFPKFFNFGETEETKPEKLPAEVPQITEKVDGSLGIQYYAGNKVCIATRGSFTSDQAIWATHWIQEKGLIREDFAEGYTYLYEIIYPDNRIVVDYGSREELILLAMIETETGEEANIDNEMANLPISTVKKYKESIEEIITQLPTLDANNEGFVARYSNGLRVKMKGDEYKRLHKILTSISARTIWEYLSTGIPIDEIIQRVPNEFCQWVKETEAGLLAIKAALEQQVNDAYNAISSLSTRKEQALVIMANYSDISPLIFRKLDGKKYDDILWKKLYPNHVRPFKNQD